MAASVVLSFDEDEARNEVIETSIYRDHLHVKFGPVTIIFYNAQQGIDILDSLATVPPIDVTPNPNQMKLEV